jgi:selenide,water dikinase
VGILAAAVKKDKIDAEGYRELIANTTRLNTPGALLSELDGVHALTDVTGFGLLGHTLELCRGAGLTARLSMRDVPLLPRVKAMVAEGFVTGASGRNWASYGRDVELGPDITPVDKALLTDPQTSGGLLVSCAREAVDDVLSIFRRDGFAHAAVIGEMNAGRAYVAVE